jgi:hypothetical protein
MSASNRQLVSSPQPRDVKGFLSTNEAFGTRSRVHHLIISDNGASIVLLDVKQVNPITKSFNHLLYLSKFSDFAKVATL